AHAAHPRQSSGHRVPRPRGGQVTPYGAAPSGASAPGGASLLRPFARPDTLARRPALLPGHEPPLLSGEALHRRGDLRGPAALLVPLERVGDLAPRAGDAWPSPSLHAALRGAAFRAGFQVEPSLRAAARGAGRLPPLPPGGRHALGGSGGRH